MLEPSKISSAPPENTVESRKAHPGVPTEPCYIDYDKVDGNAFAVIAGVDQVLKGAGASKEYRDLVRKDMMAGDYDHLLQVAIAEVEYEPSED